MAAQGNVQPSATAIAAQALDMLGTWAADCARPASNTNNYLTYRIDETGSLRHERDFGGDSRDGRDVQALRALPAQAYEITVKFNENNQTRVWVNVLGADGRRRTMSNHQAGTSSYSVRDGVLVHNGRATEWLSRCSRVTS